MRFVFHGRTILSYLARVLYLLFLMVVLVFFWHIGSSWEISSQEILDEKVNKEKHYDFTRLDEAIEPIDNPKRINLNQEFGDYIINWGGDYILSGKLNGRLYIEAEDQNVHLFFNDVVIDSYNGAGIYVRSAAKAFITSLPNTENSISDSVYGTDTEVDACIFSNSSITINGNGKLTVYSTFDKGIHSKDIVKIYNTNLNIISVGDSLYAHDGVACESCWIDIQSEKNGIVVGKEGNKTWKAIQIANSAISILAGEYCLNSVGDISVEGSSLYLNGVFGNTKSDGDIIIEEGNILRYYEKSEK